MEKMELECAAFVDAMREDLIQRVSSVEAVADELLQKSHINKEEYSNIRAQPTNQKKMRQLYQSLNNPTSKAAFYEALLKIEPVLVEDIKKEFRKKGVAFVDAMRDKLIQRVNSVEAVADKLLAKSLIHEEEYSNIRAEYTKQRKMRELYDSLNNPASKAAFYEALQNKEPFLVEDLEKEFRKTGAAFVADKKEDLIQMVNSVEAVAKELLQKSHISKDEYSKITAQPTNQMKMIELYELLRNGIIMAACFEALLKKDKFFEALFKNEVSKTVTGLQTVDDETQRKLEGYWQRHRKDNKYSTKFKDFLKDHQLKSLGNGKLFFCKKDKYKIGSGAGGTQVYIGMRDDGTEVAIKRMVSDNYKQMEDEMKVLRNPSLEESQNIVRYLDFTEDEDFVYLCLQLCEYDFEEYKTTKKLDQDELKKVTKQVLLGLQALHKANIIHRDIKPSNILIDVQGNARLADFGICRMVNQGASTVHTSRAGTRGWEAAEILKGNPDGKCAYKKSSDIQVAGMLVYYILSGGDHPFGTIAEREVNILGGNYNLDKITDVEAKDLIEKMLSHEPQYRLRVKEAVDHPYFWDDAGRKNVLRIVGDKKCVQDYRPAIPNSDIETFRKAVEKYPYFSDWKSKVTEKSDHAEDLGGLLRFLRNRLVHSKETFNQNKMYKDKFPDFYIYANQLAKDMDWHKDTNWE